MLATLVTMRGSPFLNSCISSADRWGAGSGPGLGTVDSEELNRGVKESVLWITGTEVDVW